MVGGLKSSPTIPSPTPIPALPDTVVKGWSVYCTKSLGHKGTVQWQNVFTSIVALIISFDSSIKYLSQPPDSTPQEDRNSVLFLW